MSTLNLFGRFVKQAYLRVFALALCIDLCGSAFGADVNVLVIGSSNGTAYVSTTKPFSATQIGTELNSILSGVAGLGSVNVTVKERYASSPNYCYNLAQWFHYPYPEGVEASRWADLRGEGGTNWDYVVLIGDPYTMEYMPGMYAHGVAKIAEEVTKGPNPAEVILLMQWPASGSTSSIAHYKEVTYRAGRSGGSKVAPGGLAWQAIKGTALTNPNPDADGAFIAAASIYSTIYQQSAKVSTYVYNDTWADTVNTIEINNRAAKNYTGNFSFQNPYLMLGDKRRYVAFEGIGTSTEFRFGVGASRALARSSVLEQSQGNPIAWNHGRVGNYVIDPSKYQLAYGFNYQLTMSSGATLEYANNLYCGLLHSRDAGRADSMMLYEGPTARPIPMMTLWAQIHQLDPTLNPKAENDLTDTHNADTLNEAVGTYMYTLYSGRCPLDPEPATYDLAWEVRKIGYETAWRVGRCQTRAPGFKVMPSSINALTVTPDTSDTMTVQFIMQPRSNVSVFVTSSDTSAAIVGPKELVFTPANYNVPQTVKFTGVRGATTSAPFNVQFSTTSDDLAYDGLDDSWTYTCNRSSTSVTHVNKGVTSHITYKNTALSLALGVAGASQANTVLVGPNHGTVAWDGSNVIYTPDTDYIGPDGFSFRSLVGTSQTVGTIDIDVNNGGYPGGTVRAEVIDGTATEEGQTTGTFAIIREGATTSPLAVNFSLSGTATAGSDYTLSALSPVMIPAGQSSVSITLTPVDDSVFGERDELATLTIADGAGYTAVKATATIVIEDNDNRAPVVNAGPDQSPIIHQVKVAWTPANMGAVGWYDASDASTITQSGGGVSQWADKSGSGYHLGQSMPAERPLLASAGINGLPAIDFDGFYQTLETTGNPFGTTVNDAFVITVHKNDKSMYGTLFSLTGSTREEGGWQAEAPNGIGDVIFTYDSYGTAQIRTPYDVSVGQSVLTSFYGSTTDNVMQIHKNGALLAGKNTGYAVNTVGNIVVGGTGSLFWKMVQDAKVGEFIVINGTVSEGERQKLEGYLAHKWGVAGDLPADHPYKAEVPMEYITTVNLDGTATDADGDTLATSWTTVSGPSHVTYGNAAAVDTTATFTAPGTYILRLTATDGIDQSFDEITITVTAAPNAQSQSVVTQKNEALPVILSATDLDGDALTYTVVSPPAHGTLSGTAPNLTYTPNPGYAGPDSFTFKANDGTLDSLVATVAIIVNSTPLVDAGLSQTVPIQDQGYIAPWTPAEMATTAWYDAADASKVQTNGSGVTSWLDKSGNGLHLSQINASLQPVTGATINSLNAIDFTGDIMATASNPFGAVVSNAFVIAVHKVDSTANGALFSLTGSSANLWQSTAPHDGSLYFDCGGVGVPNRVNTSYGVSAGSEVLVSFYCSTAANVQQVYKNGTLLVGDSSGHAVATAGKITVGGVDARYQDTTIGEFIIINGTVDAATRQKFEGYLAHKWGLAANLPAGHPYKNDAPLTGIGLPSPYAVATLDGTVSDADGDSLASTWTTVSGPGPVYFGNAATVDSTAIFPVAGNYVLRLTVSDGFETVFDDVVVFATIGSGPVVDAGPDQVVALTDGGASWSWTPAEMATTAWYDAADASKVQTNGSGVTSWLDKSGNGLHLSQTNASLQPVAGATINSLNAIDFTGDIMATAGNPFGATISNAFVIAVHKVDALATGTFFSLTGSSANRWQSHAPYGDGKLYFDCGVGGAPNRVTTSYGVSAGSEVLVSFYCSTIDNVQQVYKNGILLVGDSSGHAAATAGKITVGGVDASYQDTTIGEFIIINGTVDAATRQKFEGYLAHKWGLTNSLPAGHPYKAAAPGGSGTGVVVTLDGAVSDADNDPLTTTWSKVSGPGPVYFENAAVVDTTAILTVAGNYILRLTTFDGLNTIFDEVVVTATDGTSNVPPVANAGADQTVTDTDGSGSESVTLDGSGSSDSDGTIASYVWKEGATQIATGVNPAVVLPVGVHTITLTVTDNGGATATDTVVVTVNAGAVNHAPVANAQSVTTTEDTAKSITLTGSDADGDTLSYAIVTQPAHGTLSGTAPNVTYTPAVNYNGSDSFTFKVNDGTVDSTVATVSITVTAVNDAPVANAGTDQTVTDTDGSGSESVTLDGSGSSDSDGTIAGYVWKEGATQIATGVNPAVVLPVGVHTITLTVTDNGGATATDTVTITVNAAPAYLLPFEEDFEALTLGGLDGQRGWTANNAVVKSSVAFASSQAVSIDSEDGFVKHDFTGSQTNVWTDMRLQPVFSPEAMDASANATVVFYFNTNGNPVVYDGATPVVLSGTTVSPGQWVRISIHSDYVAKTWDLYIDEVAVQTGMGFYNTAAVNYQSLEVSGGSSIAGAKLDEVYIGMDAPLFTGANNPPVANAQSVTTAEDTAKAITLTGSDADGDPLTYTVVTQPAHGTLSGTAPNVTYTPVANYSGSDSFTFKVNDGTVDSAVATVSITVTAVNDLPTVTLTGPVNGASFMAPATIGLTATASDIDGTITKVEFYNGASLIGSDTGSPYSFSWANVAAGTYTLTAKATDNQGGVRTSASVTVTVNPVTGLPSPWQSLDIGTVGLAGSASFSNGTYTVKGAGAGIGGNADALQFVQQIASGDCDIKVRVASLTGTGAARLGGVMIREALTETSREAGVWVTADNITFTYRTTTGGKTTTKTAAGAAPVWVRLIRSGKTFSAYYSDNGSTWTQVGSSVNINMVNNVYMGMGVSSGTTDTLATGTVESVTAAP